MSKSVEGHKAAVPKGEHIHPGTWRHAPGIPYRKDHRAGRNVQPGFCGKCQHKVPALLQEPRIFTGRQGTSTRRDLPQVPNDETQRLRYAGAENIIDELRAIDRFPGLEDKRDRIRVLGKANIFLISGRNTIIE